ncbi:histidine kinase [Solirubrobacter ginsenosidimutans]|uniref:histidine kinase n=1 Tax=Solirubrobacter ginsenosidimutans TaxID=490573 RepID=A0A9X3MWE0_9ACTN|nr:histidine kinase [Solirubrobacter ginsenosidimutans]MDA0162470.1 histidine kinase [Solirubrobacter ginsenosidimutans]
MQGSSRTHGLLFWAALWAAAIVCEFLALWPVLSSGGDPVQGWDVLYRLIGGSFAACGLIAWHRRPDSRSGLLMTATGFAFFITPLLSQLDAPAAQTAGMLLSEVYAFGLVALILTLLTGGRFTSNGERLLMAAFVLPLLVGQFVWLLFYEDDANVLGVFANADVAEVLDKLQRSITFCACVTAFAVIALRFRAASPPRRRALLPSLAGGTALLLFALVLVNDLITGSRSEALLWIAIASLVAVPAAFLFGLLRSRLARGGLAELLLGLQSKRSGELQAALARTLGDPRLVVAQRLPESDAYVGVTGEPVALPEPGGERAVARIERRGTEVAAIVYDASLDDDPELVEAVRAATGIALENQHLHAESEARVAELRASRERLVAAGDAERRRLERNLHDGAQQRLVAIALQLRLLQSRVRGDASAEQLVTTASAELANSLEELRELARGIHPAILEHGLDAALDSLALRCHLPATVDYETLEPIPPDIALAAYFVASEALANVAKYAQASAVALRVWVSEGAVHIEIADDGIGGADPANGSGLRGLRDRVEALDGRLSVTSPAGVGTTVTAQFPFVS